jgi:hypothetical protein
MRTLQIGDLVRLNAIERERFEDTRTAQIKSDCNDVGGVCLTRDLGGTKFWHREDLELVDTTKLEALISEYETAIVNSATSEADRLSGLVEEEARRIGYDNHARIMALHSLAEQWT